MKFILLKSIRHPQVYKQYTQEAPNEQETQTKQQDYPQNQTPDKPSKSKPTKQQSPTPPEALITRKRDS
jgi:hypothetical protein